MNAFLVVLKVFTAKFSVTVFCYILLFVNCDKSFVIGIFVQLFDINLWEM